MTFKRGDCKDGVAVFAREGNALVLRHDCHRRCGDALEGDLYIAQLDGVFKHRAASALNGKKPQQVENVLALALIEGVSSEDTSVDDIPDNFADLLSDEGKDKTE